MTTPERPSTVRAVTIAESEQPPALRDDAAGLAARRALFELALGGLVRARQHAEIVSDSLAKTLNEAREAEAEIRLWIAQLDAAIAAMSRGG